MKRSSTSLGRALWVLSLLLLAATAHAQTSVHTFDFGGQTRSYRIYVPVGYTGATAVPLVFNLHGYTSNALQQEFYSGMNAVADTAGFLVCYPDGVGNAWNSGFQLPYYGGVDDVGFISVLIDSLQAAFNIDPARVYSCGMSNGGYMSYRLACDLEGRIAAIASVTGAMTTIQLNNCQCTRPMPVLEIHGTADGTVPYSGGFGSMNIDSVLRYWRGVNQCSAPGVYDTLPNTNTADQSTVTTQWYGGCDSSVEVAHFKVEGGGHTWPGSAFQIPGDVTNQDMNASVEIWKFFYRFSHPAPLLTAVAGAHPQGRPHAFPNPSAGRFQVAGLQAGDLLRLMDMQGHVVCEWAAAGTEMSLDATAIPAGVYGLLVQQGASQTALRVQVLR